MKAANHKAFALLTALGCAVEEIPETNEERADLRATDTSSTYIVEVKQKIDDIGQLRADMKQMADGGVIQHSEPLSQHNRVDNILKKAGKQLEHTPKANDDFCLIWFIAGGIDSHVYWNRAFATFYGYVELWALEPPAEEFVDCFYFDFSAAWSMPYVDAMVLVDRNNLQLCLNEFSPRLDAFRQSDLFNRLSAAVVDPLRLQADNTIIALHSNVSRKREEDVLDELLRKTGVRYNTLRPQQHSASVMVDRNRAENTPNTRN